MTAEGLTVVLLRLGVENKLKTWAATDLPTRWLDPYMRGGDCQVFSYDPLIIYVPDWIIRYKPVALLRVLRQFSNRNIYLLILLSWAHDNPYLIKQLTLWQERHLRRYPRHRIIFMANSEAEHRMMTAAGLMSAWVSHNAFVSPAIFRYLQESDKRFDAVYDARVDPFKRHKLAAAIESLALITARSQDGETYMRSIRRILTQAYWFNDPLPSDYRVLSLSEINAALNQCRVGLCLSAEEGAMYASIQYLLAGLPIVSTQSRGGRDEFFAPDYVRIVDDNMEAVAAGVKDMCECPVPPEEIRHRTLEKIEQHKIRLFELLDTICSAEGLHVDLRQSWDSWAVRILSVNATPDVIRKHINDAAISQCVSPRKL
jgi:glycosyltransferase involved in cell wall biosynthesis